MAGMLSFAGKKSDDTSVGNGGSDGDGGVGGVGGRSGSGTRGTQVFIALTDQNGLGSGTYLPTW